MMVAYEKIVLFILLRWRNGYLHVSEFHSGKIVAYQLHILSFLNNATHYIQNPTTVIQNRWALESHPIRHIRDPTWKNPQKQWMEAFQLHRGNETGMGQQESATDHIVFHSSAAFVRKNVLATVLDAKCESS
ncbi:hypothetical protein TNCV_4925961 [Trichonephila clavipes]|nr:hypothetical protein TNCV_4925961 [Trichonephila clavipes]